MNDVHTTAATKITLIDLLAALAEFWIALIVIPLAAGLITYLVCHDGADAEDLG